MTLLDGIMTMKTVLYARVSTAEQTIDHQRTQAEAAGFRIDVVVADQGVSGVHARLIERPQGRPDPAGRWGRHRVPRRCNELAHGRTPR